MDRLARSALTTGLWAIAASGVVPAQTIDITREAEVGRTLNRWARAFDRGRLELEGDFRDSDQVYGEALDDHGVLARYERSALQFTNRQLLSRLLDSAGELGTEACVHGALAIAAVGLERSPYQTSTAIVRELGHWTVMRIETDAGRTAVYDLAAESVRSPSLTSVGVRVAALRVLGERERDSEPARAIVRTALTERDPRVRLAAAEALGRMGSVDCLDALLTAFDSEKHPVVAQAVVQAVGRTIGGRRGTLRQAEVDRTLAAVLPRLGSIGWRIDVDLIELAERNPSKTSVPFLIDLLAGGRGNALRRAVHRNGAPLLRDRAVRVLRRLTGAILEIDDVRGWRAFWARESDRVVLPEPDRPQTRRARTQSGFFGIPVLGRETAFLIDTSKSMRDLVRLESNRGERVTRLHAASRQLLHAVQSMPRNWKFRVFTFAANVRVWNQRGSRPDARTLRALTARIEALEPGGMTDIRKALAAVLRVDEARFGKTSRNPFDEVFLLSDGMLDDSDDAEEMLGWVREANRYQKIRINTIFTGSGPGSELLRRLAAENGGDFVQH